MRAIAAVDQVNVHQRLERCARAVATRDLPAQLRVELMLGSILLNAGTTKPASTEP
jgi:hypothetical protein